MELQIAFPDLLNGIQEICCCKTDGKLKMAVGVIEYEKAPTGLGRDLRFGTLSIYRLTGQITIQVATYCTNNCDKCSTVLLFWL